jgi:hypothetical protein
MRRGSGSNTLWALRSLHARVRERIEQAIRPAQSIALLSRVSFSAHDLRRSSLISRDSSGEICCVAAERKGVTNAAPPKKPNTAMLSGRPDLLSVERRFSKGATAASAIKDHGQIRKRGSWTLRGFIGCGIVDRSSVVCVTVQPSVPIFWEGELSALGQFVRLQDRT